MYDTYLLTYYQHLQLNARLSLLYTLGINTFSCIKRLLEFMYNKLISSALSVDIMWYLHLHIVTSVYFVWIDTDWWHTRATCCKYCVSLQCELSWVVAAGITWHSHTHSWALPSTLTSRSAAVFSLTYIHLYIYLTTKGRLASDMLQ